MLPGAKTSGASLGVAGGAWLAPELTTVTKHWMGYPVDPEKLEQSVTVLVTSFWVGVVGAAGLIGALIANYYWRRAQERWGNGHVEPQMVPPSAPVPPSVTQ